jgi:hypothetical protein
MWGMEKINKKKHGGKAKIFSPTRFGILLIII